MAGASSSLPAGWWLVALSKAYDDFSDFIGRSLPRLAVLSYQKPPPSHFRPNQCVISIKKYDVAKDICHRSIDDIASCYAEDNETLQIRLKVITVLFRHLSDDSASLLTNARS